MTISLSQACLPVCTAMLGHLSHLLDKARADAQSRGFDVNVHITERFAPDMLPFKNQIFIACDVVKNGVARVAGTSRSSQLAGRNVTINNLLPGAFDTDRLRSNQKTIATKAGKSIEEVSEARRKTIPAQRFGTAQEFGETCAFLCSQQASYITGQNILIDGGAYPGAF